MTVLWVTLLHADFSERNLGFSSKLLHAKFLVDELTVEHVLLR
jgi:hypothetical protein